MRIEDLPYTEKITVADLKEGDYVIFPEGICLVDAIAPKSGTESFEIIWCHRSPDDGQRHLNRGVKRASTNVHRIVRTSVEES